MAYCTDPVKLPVKYMADSGDLLLERESWIKKDTTVVNCVGKFDVTAFQLGGLKNRVGTEKLLWKRSKSFLFCRYSIAIYCLLSKLSH